jgi:hypothetical protein
MRFTTIFFIAICIKLISCTPCACTLVWCYCVELSISIEANVESDIDGSYSAEEINEFYLIRTNKSFNIIDSVKMEFQNHGGNVDYNSLFEIKQSTFTNNENLRHYNFLIKNLILKSVDTVSAILYTEEMESRICNHCSGRCDDEYIDCLQFSNLSLVFNGIVQDDFNVRISK